MKYAIALIACCAFVGACTVKTEKVVERPVPATTATVVTSDPPPTTVVRVN
jgi:hypothetical protein